MKTYIKKDNYTFGHNDICYMQTVLDIKNYNKI